MKLRTGLMGVGAVLAMVMAAQSAQAQSCPTGNDNGGNPHQIEVPPEGTEPCAPMTGYSTVTATALDATGTSYTADLTFEPGEQYLQIGEYVEVEIDIDDVMASLRANPKAAVRLVSSLGLRDDKEVVAREAKTSVTHAVNRASSAKATDAEYAMLATYIKTNLQTRATGRSDTATNTTTSRLERGVQAFERAVSSLGRAVSDAIPDFKFGMREKIRNSNNVVVREREITVELS